jgi:hypothetical protein
MKPRKDVHIGLTSWTERFIDTNVIIEFSTTIEYDNDNHDIVQTHTEPHRTKQRQWITCESNNISSTSSQISGSMVFGKLWAQHICPHILASC